ncbi:Protein esc1 [Ceratocystis fimbriata CBS 114723]|uniref:Protein esc1 n=1 Tax=Ceratocystis fimbriata CBS 114723 TaxID=1035309 RepID=A0A2C5WJF1_9PEZI|nr:Protein esc1 [Ceratocystis fimbriata CBS 114723]
MSPSQPVADSQPCANAPLGLRDMLNNNVPERHDSAYYGTPSEASSKRMDIESPQSSPSPHTTTGGLTAVASPDNSAASFAAAPGASTVVASAPPYAYAPRSNHETASPSPTSAHRAASRNSTAASLATTTNMSVASIMSPAGPAPTPGSFAPNDPHRSSSSSSRQRYYSRAGDPPQHTPTSTIDTDNDRRESVDSRMSQNLNEMQINNTGYLSAPTSMSSPYPPHIQNSAAAQRIPKQKFEPFLSHRMSNGYQPSAERTPLEVRIDRRTSRTAPTITGPTQGIIARAAEPTKGQAWAFPEDERSGSYTESRRSSLADSINSSQFTSESRLPPSQARLDAQSMDGHRLSSTSNEYLPMHHHSIQHKKISDLQDENRSSTGQPYSRTPELRQSHKLAERKRRTEMKELFEQLREMMPQERGAKASKWEILTKAINEIRRLNDTMRNMSIHYNGAVNEIENHRREIHGLRMENAELRAKINSHGLGHHSSSHSSAAPPPPHTPHSSHPTTQQHPPPPSPAQPPAQPSSQPGVSPHSTHQYGGSFEYNTASRPELPSLRSLNNQLPPPPSAPAGPDSMTGIQYDSHRSAY